MRQIFNSKYPIISALMNQVSNLELAVEVYRAGGFPSISGYCYQSIDSFINDIETFIKITGSTDIMVGVDNSDFIKKECHTRLKDLAISHLYLYPNQEPKISQERRNNFEVFSNSIAKKLKFTQVYLLRNLNIIADDPGGVYIVKGSEGAGSPGELTTKEMFFYFKEKYPNITFVAMGGISTPNDVEFYINNGAIAVAIGTLIAASKESCLSIETKNKIISSTSRDLINFKDTGQQSLIFTIQNNDDHNHTISLKKGIKTGIEGHIFAGAGIDSVTHLESIYELFPRLTAKLLTNAL